MNEKSNTDDTRDVILLVDDEEGIRSQLKWALADEYRVLLAKNETEALELLEKELPDLVTLDVFLSNNVDTDGIRILEKFNKFDSTIKIIMITGSDKKDIALKAVQIGAYDYYQKPIDTDEIKIIIKRALYIRKLELENIKLSRQLRKQIQFKDIIGNSRPMLEVYDIMRKVLSSDVAVLISGESGTGKELVAKAIHYQSLRKDKPFIPINCGAIPENLLESELFGHEKGAFTGAYQQKKGKFELANGGTAFLDEIGEMNPKLQVKLLRFLQEKEVERIGGSQPIPVNVRILAATNKNLEEEIKNQKFRTDLYYRLGVISIALPSLRERVGDISLLANYFLNKYSKEYGKKIINFDSLAVQYMNQYAWPGNVRELENRIKRAVIMCHHKYISCKDLDISENLVAKKESLVEIINSTQKKYIDMALYRTRGNISKAAKELGISRVTLYDLLNKLKIEVHDYRKKRIPFINS